MAEAPTPAQEAVIDTVRRCAEVDPPIYLDHAWLSYVYEQLGIEINDKHDGQPATWTMPPWLPGDIATYLKDSDSESMATLELELDAQKASEDNMLKLEAQGEELRQAKAELEQLYEAASEDRDRWREQAEHQERLRTIESQHTRDSQNAQRSYRLAMAAMVCLLLTLVWIGFMQLQGLDVSIILNFAFLIGGFFGNRLLAFPEMRPIETPGDQQRTDLGPTDPGNAAANITQRVKDMINK